jgi:FtsH-binding integral membrane protein
MWLLSVYLVVVFCGFQVAKVQKLTDMTFAREVDVRAAVTCRFCRRAVRWCLRRA